MEIKLKYDFEISLFNQTLNIAKGKKMSLETQNITSNSMIKMQNVDMSISLMVGDELYRIQRWEIDKKIFVIDSDLRLNKGISSKVTIVFFVRGKKFYLKTLLVFQNYKEGNYTYFYRRISDGNRDILKYFVQFAIYKRGDKKKSFLSKQTQIKVSSHIPNISSKNCQKHQNTKKHSNIFLYCLNFLLAITFFKFN